MASFQSKAGGNSFCGINKFHQKGKCKHLKALAVALNDMYYSNFMQNIKATINHNKRNSWHLNLYYFIMAQFLLYSFYELMMVFFALTGQ